MSKTINKVQAEMLISSMQKNPAIERNFVKENKEKVADFWKQLEKQLNSAGPPIKSIAEWKKVWMDQKRYVRKKAATSYKNQRSTGGGPNLEIKLSPIEENILELIGSKVSIEGIERARSFGINQPAPEQENELPICPLAETDDENVEIDFEDLPTTSSASLIQKKRRTEQPATFLPRNKTPKICTNDLVKELEIQRNLCDKIGEAVKLMENNNTEIQTSVNQINRSLDRLCDTHNLVLQESKRHNAEMEKLRTAEVESKLEKNRILIELHEIQLQKAKRED